MFLWAITADPKLSALHRQIYLDGANELSLSIASIWELLIKSGNGKLTLPTPTASYLLRQAERNRLHLLPVRPAHLVKLESLPPVHKDPFDRMLVAQADAEGMTILSDDAAIRSYGVKTL